ncbi:MAG: hypothetical protein RLZZ627_1364 [Pseudomonadota bacterium]|jgi:hypothetical protein
MHSNVFPLSIAPLRWVSVFFLAVLMSACASKSAKPPANLTPEHYAKTTTVTPRPDQDAIHLNTEKGFEEPYEDNRHYRGTYLLAAVDRKSGKAAIGVDFMQMTDTPRTKVVVTYDSPEGMMRQTIYVKSGRRLCRENDCRVLESISIPLKESLVRHYAKLYSPNLATHWTYRIGDDYTGEISYAEMAGLIESIDRARKSLPSSAHGAE